MSAALTFLGAAGTVTGAKFLVASDGARLLLECGMFQGLRELRARNWEAPPVQPGTLAAVLLSHAHIDHSGYLPRLVRDGFEGPIFCSPGTADLLILGASTVEVVASGRRLVYSGDLGRYDVPIMRDPVAVASADTLLVESTYGDRLHPAGDATPVIGQAVQRAADLRGWLLVPAFAIGRTQDLLYVVRELEEAGRIPRLPVYLDSPMGIESTAIYERHPEEHDPATIRITAVGKRPFVPARFHLCPTADESKKLNGIDGPGVIIAGSGMATGGRILHHLRHRLADERTTVLFVGYQAAGTRGRLLRDGASRLRIFGEDVSVRATIMATDALSAHADQGEIIRWLRGFTRPPAMTYCVHGEPAAAAALRAVIEQHLGWRCAVAADLQQIEL
ncbi:MAG: MBL fold metallo-hydrolase [Candidatus Rokuibacteriota bacterium]|nr:MAG: MBL fold metallo-hydrolase [Candidatus Rokubacteria bacterium]